MVFSRVGLNLSPKLFSVYMIHSVAGCYVDNVYVSIMCFMQTACVMAPSALALQELLNIVRIRVSL